MEKTKDQILADNITVDDLNIILEDLVSMNTEPTVKGSIVVVTKTSALKVLYHMYIRIFSEKETKVKVDKAKKTLENTEGPYIITETGVAPYGFKLARNESKTKK